VGHADGAVGLVDVLAAGSGSPHCDDVEILRIDRDVDVVLKLRHDIDGSERGVAASGGVKRRDADQAMHALLRFQIAVGHRPFNQNAAGLDAGFFTLLVVQDGDLEAAALGPAAVHAVQHLRPVHGLRAAGSRMQFQDGVVGIIGMGQQDLDLIGVEVLEGFLVLFLDDAGEILVKIALQLIDGGGEIRESGVQPVIVFLQCLQRIGFADDGLGFLLVIPEAGRVHQRFIFFDFLLAGSEVKERSQAAPI